jgi:membrane protease YdiL (CAAX protease family)
VTKRRSAALNEPLLLFYVFVGVGLGTVALPQDTRLAVLWTTLALLTLLRWSREGVQLDLSLPAVGRGALLAGVISLPLLALLPGQLQVFAERLYGTNQVVLLFYQVCFVSAPVEEAFFRGVILDDRGPSMAAGLYALSVFLLFAPHVPILVALLVAFAAALLGLIYGYVREHYGLAAAITCHVVSGFMLQVMPSLIDVLHTLLV